MIDILSLIQKYLLSWQSFAIYVILFLVYIIFKMAVKKAARTKPGIGIVILLPFLGIALVYLHLLEWSIVVFLLFGAALMFYWLERDRQTKKEYKAERREQKVRAKYDRKYEKKVKN